MAGINPISNSVGPVSPSGISGAGSQKPPTGKSSFGDMLKTYVNNVDGDRDASMAAIRDLVSGKTEDILPVVSAVAKADLSFKLLLGVRNKVIEAYKQTMNMQI